jgi:tetratricopeptide (TPR) repeat protein
MSVRTPAAAVLVAMLLLGCSSAPKQSAQVVDKKNRASEYTDFGNRSYTEGDYAAALTFFEQALAINLSVDNGPGVVKSLCSVGAVHIALGQRPQAEEVFVRARRLAATAGDTVLEVQSAVSLGELLIAEGRSGEARELLAGELRSEGALAGTRDLAILYHTLATAEKKLGRLDEARSHAELALAINTKLKALEDVAANHFLLASIHSKREDYAAALASAQTALETDKRIENSLGIAQDLLAMGIIATRLGRSEQAFDYFERSYGIYSALRLSSGLRSVLPELVDAARRVGRGADADAYAAKLVALGAP